MRPQVPLRAEKAVNSEGSIITRTAKCPSLTPFLAVRIDTRVSRLLFAAEEGVKGQNPHSRAKTNKPTIAMKRNANLTAL